MEKPSLQQRAKNINDAEDEIEKLFEVMGETDMSSLCRFEKETIDVYGSTLNMESEFDRLWQNLYKLRETISKKKAGLLAEINSQK